MIAWPCGCASFSETGQILLCEKHAFVPTTNGMKSCLPGGPEEYGLQTDPAAGPPPYQLMGAE